MITTELYHGDCLEFMQDMANKGKKVDCIITDPPYLYLKHKLDRKFNEELFFELAGKITDKIVFFGRGDSFYKWNLLAKEQGFEFKEEIIWNKRQLSNPLGRIIRIHETISIRAKKGITLNRVKECAFKKSIREGNIDVLINDLKRVFSSIKNSDIIKNYLERGETLYKGFKKAGITTGVMKNNDRSLEVIKKYNEGTSLSSIIVENREHYTMQHPTQKPYKLIEKLIQLVSNKNDTILDTFMGSGSTGIACLTQERNFIGCEIDKEYFDIAENRIKDKKKILMQNLFYCLE